jgi:pimeloyl-ACP methyl ester carboxylesterase
MLKYTSMAEAGEVYIEEVHTLHASDEDLPFEITVSGAEIAKTALILVHGFGVRRDSRGLFTEIADATKEVALTVRGDYSVIDGDVTKAIPFSKQASRLSVIRDFCRKELGIKREVLVGHSQGWLPIALNYPLGSKVTALAPPLGDAFEAFIQTSGWKRRGSELNLEGESRLLRSDGSLTLVPKEFWDEFRAMGDVTKSMAILALYNKLNIIFAGEDNVLGTQDVPDIFRTEMIAGANHDFTDGSRKAVISKITKDLY